MFLRIIDTQSKDGSACDIIVSIVEKENADTSINPGWDWCISESTTPLGKGMNPIILPPAMGK